jgi:hypothetical protein
VLATNENHTKKLVWYERYSQKCCLANVAPTSGEPHLYKMKMQLSRDEILELSDRLAKVKKGNDVLELLSEGEDYLQKPTCLRLQTSKYKGLVLLRYVANKPAVAIITSIPNGDEDPDAVSEMVDTSPNVQPEAEWREQFAKFFIGKNDDWVHMGKVLREFIAAVDAENDDATATQSMPPPPTPAKDPPLTKKSSDKKTTTKKRKAQLEDSDDEVKMTVASMLYLMSKHQVSYEVVLIINRI